MGICKHYICAWWIVAISGISPDVGNYVTRLYIGTWQQFFRTFSDKRRQRGEYIKCAKVRTKKEFCNTIHAWGEKPWFSGQNWICGHDTCAGEIIRKVTKSYTKKECASRHIGHPKKILQIPHPLKEYSELSESIKRVCRDSQDLKRAAHNRQFRQS